MVPVSEHCPTVRAVTEEESRWRWQRTGDPVGPAQQRSRLPAGELCDAGITVSGMEAEAMS